MEKEVFQHCEFFRQDNTEEDCIISGGAKGADTLARQFAYNHNVMFIEYPAKWDEFGKRAGILRNMEMVEAADEVIAFWDGESRGTEFTIKYAEEKGKALHVIRY